ncbi:major facilitator superfamily domain-containing protein [Pseudoneurospora amorphoporcata]|uniref:Major facilitator superfamily domain-containing protein n=1 Tax=Pseudoneurospora amorphoporcata TaxID=241081 RepID=A0AAN6SCU7_9PEZI|nr:major facilitator superfamily domain-containing protein [Pseudoneurospora amorphoporcata]
MANADAAKEYGVNSALETLPTAMYLFGMGSGALFAGPLSETFGRNPVYLTSTFGYIFFVLGSALKPNFGGHVACRYLVGLFASGTLGSNGSSVQDQFSFVGRTFAFPVIAWANVAAPVIAPIAGGWIIDNDKLGWHWTEWVTLIISGTAFLISFLFLPETYLPKLLDWKAAHLRRLTNDQRYVSQHSRNLKQKSFGQRLRSRLSLPLKFIHTEPVITVLGVYLILLYTLLFTFMSGFDQIFRRAYNLSAGQTGACFGTIAAGATSFMFAVPGLYLGARRKAHLTKDATLEPEFRLYPGFLAGPLLPAALFWLGWTDVGRIPMWSVLGACFLFGLVLMALYTSSYGYIVDSYGTHAASALSAITMLRYIIAGGMAMGTRPLFTLPGFGVQWTMTVLGGVAVLLAPAPFVFWKMGPRLRRRSLFAVSPRPGPGEKE